MEHCLTTDPKTIPPVSLPEPRETREGPAAATGHADATSAALPRVNVWLLRLRALLLVTLCATFGVLLVILPWTDKWTDNSLLLSVPELRPIISNGFVRGLCSGLGLLDLWLGFWEAIYYHEKPVNSD